MITVNDFVFCKEHGNEYCIRCTVDYRFVNNVNIDPTEDIDIETEDYNFNLDVCTVQFGCQSVQILIASLKDRSSINVYDLGARLHTPALDSADAKYSCVQHGAVDCSRCFNWLAMVKNEIKEAEKDAKWLEKRRKWLDRVD